MREGEQTRRENLESRLDRANEKGRATADIERDLEMPPFPAALGYVWQRYLRIRHRVAMGFNGPNPIGWQDIDAFIRRSGMSLAPWEIELIEAIDDLYLMSTIKKPQPAGPPLAASAPMEDPKAVRSVLSGIGQRRSKPKGGQANG